MSTIQLSDDAIEVEYRGQTYRIDELKAYRLYGALEGKHQLQEGEELTDGFLDDLVDATGRLGLVGATTGAALQLYRAIAARLADLKKKRESEPESPTGMGSIPAPSRARRRRPSP